MTDRALWNATAKRDRLKIKIQLLEEALTKRRIALDAVSMWIDTYHEFAGTALPASPSRTRGEHSQDKSGTTGEVGDAPASPERRRTVGNPKKELVAEEARRIIEKAEQPVSRADLFKELADNNIIIEGKDPEQVLSTMLWRTRDKVPIVRVPSGGYWLADRPHHPSGYVHGSPTMQEPDTLGDTRNIELYIANIIKDLGLSRLIDLRTQLRSEEAIPAWITSEIRDLYEHAVDEDGINLRLFEMISKAVDSRISDYQPA